MPRYFLLRRFDLVALHGRVPLFFRPLPTITLNPLQNNELGALVQFLNRKSIERPLGPVFEEDHFLEKLKTWPNLQPSDFIIAKDKQGNIIGCCAPWSIDQLKDLRVEKHHGTAGLVRKIFSCGSPFGVTRRLAGEGESLHVSYLTHLFADNPDIFFSLLSEAWRRTAKTQTLLYPHFKGEIQTLPPNGFIYTKTPYAAYTVLPPNKKLPNFLRPRLQSPPPYFEPALL